jgi:hypothetical protein
MFVLNPAHRAPTAAKFGILIILLASTAGLGGCATDGARLAQRPTAQDWLLRVCDDEESIEKRIATYFREQYDVEAEYLFVDENDLYLQYQFSSEEGKFPDMSVFIDSAPSATDEIDGRTKVIERRVTVSAFYVLADEIKTPEIRQELLEQINLWHIDRWVPQRIYLDDDGDLVFESAFNIPGDDFPVHAEIVGDQILRMNSAWQEFYASLSGVTEIPEMERVNSTRIAINR